MPDRSRPIYEAMPRPRATKDPLAFNVGRDVTVSPYNNTLTLAYMMYQDGIRWAVQRSLAKFLASGRYS